MTTSLFISGLVPWLAVMLLLEKKIQKNKLFTSLFFPFCFVGSVVAGLLFLPVGGFSLIHWSASVTSPISLPLVGLLLVTFLERFFLCTLFLPQDWKAASLFGISGSLVLYPAALGLGPIDSYSWGWGVGPFFIVIACLTLIFLATKNRFAIFLMLAIAAFDFQWQESTNFWDYLIDPFYSIVAFLIGSFSFFREERKAPPYFFVQ